MSKTSRIPVLKSKKAADDPLTLARQALSIARSLQSSEELKYFDTTYNLTDFTNGVITPVLSIAGGNGQSQRVGNSVRVQRIQIVCKLYDLVNSNTTFRWMLCSLPQWQAVSVAGVTGVLDADSTLSFYDEESRLGMRIHHDRLVTDDSNFNLQDRVVTERYDRKLQLPVTFTGPNATDFEKNTLYLLVTADYVSVAGPIVRPIAGEAGCSFRFRIWYTDA